MSIKLNLALNGQNQDSLKSGQASGSIDFTELSFGAVKLRFWLAVFSLEPA
ncbi:hypothetical protein ACQCVK_15960 [Rossellomorea vietnamensis]|uniref:hypothetical protein n=1 Tax=Rossellomorea TaxID=2837508 RepID=UPI001653A61B|nr:MULTISPECIES: hypothetical protein [Rossellomorea]